MPARCVDKRLHGRGGAAVAGRLDQVRLVQSDSVVSEEAKRKRRTLEGLGIEPVAVASVVPDYLEQFRPRGQFSIYRP